MRRHMPATRRRTFCAESTAIIFCPGIVLLILVYQIGFHGILLKSNTRELCPKQLLKVRHASKDATLEFYRKFQWDRNATAATHLTTLKQKSLISREDMRRLHVKTNVCSPHRKLVFVKTHKAASTSVFFILLEHLKRYGTQNNQRPYPIPFIGGYPGRFDRRFTINKYGSTMGSLNHHPDVVAGHLRFSKEALDSIMPVGTKYITIMREPSSVFYSSFAYYYGEEHQFSFGQKRSNCYNSPYLDILGKFQVSFSDYLKIAPARLNSKVPWYFRSRNSQAHDLGLDPMRGDDEYISQQIRILDSSFHLVMIAEYFLESLVLLRAELCMDWSYLTAQVVNQGTYMKPNFTRQEMNSIRALTKQDYALYNYFNRTLWRKIEAYGRDKMRQDVKRITHRQSLHSNDVTNTKDESQYSSQEDVSHSFKADIVSRLAVKINQSEKALSFQGSKIMEMAEYMAANSGGCNL